MDRRTVLTGMRTAVGVTGCMGWGTPQRDPDQDEWAWPGAELEVYCMHEIDEGVEMVGVDDDRIADTEAVQDAVTQAARVLKEETADPDTALGDLHNVPIAFVDLDTEAEYDAVASALDALPRADGPNPGYHLERDAHIFRLGIVGPYYEPTTRPPD